LKLLEIPKLKILILTGKVFISVDSTTEANVVTNFSTLPISSPLFDTAGYFQNGIFPDFKTEIKNLIFSCYSFFIDTNKNLIIYNKSLQKGYTIYFNKIINS
jgi:hypothetical protein